MSSIDDRIVAMKFENSAFQRGVQATMSILDKLKQSLNFSASTKGLNDLQTAGSKFNLGGMGTHIDSVSGKFLAMATIAITALTRITNSAIDTGFHLVKSLTVDPLKLGLAEYETNLNSIQTILANTKISGATLKDVNAALAELNEFSDKTIYNFSQMAKNIGTFTAAGVDLKTATASIKGIANLAALSGSNAEQAAGAMYQLSQAISSGRVSLQDWNSVVNAGMGGTVFQRALAQTAVAMGTLDDKSVKLSGSMKNVTIAGESFRESISASPGKNSWLTSDVLTNTLQQFTGDLSKAELAAMGFNDAQIKAIQQTAKTAFQAATEVKTLSGVLDVAKESAGSGWAKTWQIIFGDFEEAKTTFTSLSGAMSGFIAKSAETRNNVLEDWKELGGRTVLFEGLIKTFQALMDVISPIKKAFRDIFPAMTGQRLFDLTVRFRDFAETLSLNEGTMDNLRRTFRGVFALFSIGIQIVKGIFSVFGDLFGAIGDGSGGILNFTGTIGDFLVSLDQAIKKGGFLTTFFDGLGAVLAIPIRLLGALGEIIGGLFDGFDASDIEGMANSFGKVGDKLSPLAGIGERVAAVWDSLAKVFSKIGKALEPLTDAIGKALSGIGGAIADSMASADFNKVLDVINTGLIAGIFLLFRNFFKGGIGVNLGGGLVESITETFGALTGTLKSMQAQVKADVLLKIAAALALLTASIFVLSQIDSKDLARGLGGMAVAFGGMQIALVAMSKAITLFGALKLPLITAALVPLAAAMLLLSFALKTLSELNWEELSKGLVGIGALLAGITLAAIPLSKYSGGILRAGLAMIPLALALKILASAVKDFSGMSWAEMSKGLVGVAGALAAVSAAVMFMPKSMVLQAAGLVVFAAGLKVLASAVEDFSDLSWKEMGKGLAGIAGALTLVAAAMYAMPPSTIIMAAGLVVVGIALKGIATAVKMFSGLSWKEMGKGMAGVAGSLALIAAAMYAMPPHMLLQAAALVVVAAALKSLGKTVENMGGMSWKEIGKGLVVLAGSLAILAGGLALMTGAIAGAAALVIAAGALAVLAPILVVLGTMSWTSIAKGLVALAGAFTVIGVAGLLLGPLTPILLGLSLAMVGFGAAIALAGAGALAFATAFGIVVAAGAAGAAVLQAMLRVIIDSIPGALAAFAEGIKRFAAIIGQAGPEFLSAFLAVMNSLLDAVIRTTPKIGKAISVLIQTGLNVLISNAPKMASAGLKLLLAFLNAIDQNIYRIVTVVSNIIIKFMRALGDNYPRIIQAGVDMILKFIRGLTKAIDQNSAAMGRAGADLAMAIIRGMVRGLSAGISQVNKAALNVAKGALNSALSFLGIKSPSKEFEKIGMYSDQGLALGLNKYSRVVDRSAAEVAKSALEVLSVSMSRVSDAVDDKVSLNPTITPVLDLTKLQKDATKITGLLAVTPISAAVSYNQAAEIAAEREQASSQDSPDSEGGEKVIQFIQNNTSPKALDEVTIYRNTRNQVSLAKEVLNAP